MPGLADLVLIAIVVLIVFGAGKLPRLATAAARAIQRMRNRSPDDDGETEDGEEDESGERDGLPPG